MNNPYLRIATPGIFLCGLMLLSIVFPVLFIVFSAVFQWVAVSTIGLPSIVAAILFWLGEQFFKIKITKLRLSLIMIGSTIPCLLLLIEVWLFFKPSDGPAMGYLGIFYIFTIWIWLPILIGWSWFCTRND